MLAAVPEYGLTRFPVKNPLGMKDSRWHEAFEKPGSHVPSVQCITCRMLRLGLKFRLVLIHFKSVLELKFILELETFRLPKAASSVLFIAKYWKSCLSVQEPSNNDSL